MKCMHTMEMMARAKFGAKATPRSPTTISVVFAIIRFEYPTLGIRNVFTPEVMCDWIAKIIQYKRFLIRLQA